MNARLRVALVGAGRIAGEHLAVLAELAAAGRVELAGIVEPDARRRDELAARHAVAVHDTVGGLLAAAAPQLVLITAPPSVHRPAAEVLLAAGCAVLCEKPLAPRLEDARAMGAAARRHGAVLEMASKFRHVETVIEARELIGRGAIGRPLLFENAFCAAVPMSASWHVDPAVSGGGVLIDNGCHAFEIARALLGPVRRVAVQEAPRRQSAAVEDTVAVACTIGDGVAGQIALSWSTPGGSRDWFARVLGDEGTLELGFSGGRRWGAGGELAGTFGAPYGKRAAFTDQLARLVGRLSGRDDAGHAPRLDLADAMASVAAVTAGYRSLAAGGLWAEVEEVVLP